MARKSKAEMEAKKQEALQMMQEVNEVSTQYIAKLDEDPEYSLEVDPKNLYNMPANQKTFIKQYCNLKNVGLAAAVSQLTPEEAQAYYMSYESQEEIRRINKAMYHRQFKTKLLSIDEIGGWLSSVLTDQVPDADKVGTMDKVRIAAMLIDLNKLKAEMLVNPNQAIKSNIEIELKSLSISTIQTLLKTSKKEMEKPLDVIDIDDNTLTPEEKAYIKSLPTKDILALIDETKKGGEN